RRAVPRAAEARRRERAPAGRQGADRRGGSRRRAGARDRGKPSAPFADPAPLRAFRRDDPPGLRRHEPRYAASDGAARHGHLVPAHALRALRDPRARRPLRDPGRRRRRAARARPRMAARVAFASALPRARDADAADDPGDARGRDPARLTSPNVPLLLRSCRRPKESAPEVSTMSQRFPIAAVALAALPACTQEPATSPSVEPDAGSAEPAADTAEPAAPTPEPAPAAGGNDIPERIVIERQGVIPEGIEYDETSGRFLVGSLGEGTVFEVAFDGTLTPFV